MMDDEGPVRGIDGPNPGLGELGIDGQGDVQLSRRDLAFSTGHHLGNSFRLLPPRFTCSSFCLFIV